MTKEEINILRNERVNQLTISLAQKAAICKGIGNKYQEEGIEVIKEAVRADICQWINQVREDYETNRCY